MPAKPNVPPIDIEATFEEEGLVARALITRTDLRGIITYASKAYRQMTKYSREELIGKPHSIVRHQDMPASSFKCMWDMIRKNIPWEGYIKNLRKDGKYYWVIVRVEPFFDDDGNKIGYVGIRREPDRKVLQEIIRKYRNMLEMEQKTII